MRLRLILFFIALSVSLHMGLYHAVRSMFINEEIELEIIDCDYPVKELRPKHCS